MGVPEHASWDAVGRRLREATPEAFEADGPSDLIDGPRSETGAPDDQHSLVGGSRGDALPQSASAEGVATIEAAAVAHGPPGESLLGHLLSDQRLPAA